MTRRRRVPLSVALAIFGAMFAVAVAVDAVEHLALLAVAVGPAVLAFWAGRRWEHRRPTQPRRLSAPARRAEPPATVVRAGRHHASLPRRVRPGKQPWITAQQPTLERFSR